MIYEEYLFFAYKKLSGLIFRNVAPEASIFKLAFIVGTQIKADCYLIETDLVRLSINFSSSVKGPNHSSTLLNHSIVTTSSLADGKSMN